MPRTSKYTMPGLDVDVEPKGKSKRTGPVSNAADRRAQNREAQRVYRLRREAFIAQVQVEHDRYQAENERLRQLVTCLATRAGIDIGDALDPDFDPESIQLGSSSASSSMSYSTAPITPVEEMALDPIPPQPIPAPITLPSPPPPPPPIAQWLDGMYASPQPVYPPLYYAGSSGPTLPRLCDPSFATPFWSGLRLYEP